MITRAQYKAAQRYAANALLKAGVHLAEHELATMDVADFGLSRFESEGAAIVSLLDTEKLALRILVLAPWQAEPEHWHEASDHFAGKEETLRVISGKLLVYTQGENTLRHGRIPANGAEYYTCLQENLLEENQFLTLPPGTRHWFQAMGEPAVFYSISTTASDARDPFTNPYVVRQTVITD